MKILNKVRWKEINWKKGYLIISFTLTLFLAQYALYHLLFHFKMQKIWIALPIVIYVFLSLVKKRIKRLQAISVSLESTIFLSFFLLFMYIRFDLITIWVEKHFDVLAVIIILALFINLAISRFKKVESNTENKKDSSTQLFNLYYLNTSKAHEIAMLIDNKIMKTIEREQISEELLKYNASTTVGQREIVSADVGYSLEDNSKKRVYENFDVKTTKSIMLRKIYETALKKKGNQQNLQVGDLTIFENIELQQMNIDDTVMILNVLQDSKINNQSNDSMEINLSKMMDKMLDDFTIDYMFTIEKNGKEPKQFIIQIPYKATENFENGYQHNDLQLGKLSLIGIYRGNINFSKRDSISSKFLEMMSDSYNQEIQKKENIEEMKLSSSGAMSDSIQFKFNHKKLNEEMHLIDVIAIIQELNFDRDE